MKGFALPYTTCTFCNVKSMIPHIVNQRVRTNKQDKRSKAKGASGPRLSKRVRGFRFKTKEGVGGPRVSKRV
jgi:hypothetical protein